MANQYSPAKAVAEVTGFTEDFIWKLARQGRIPFIKVGRSYRFNVEEVIEALKAQSQEAIAK